MATSNQSVVLEQLEVDVKAWIKKEKSRIENEVAFLKAVLEGTTGSSVVKRKNVELARIFLVEEINAWTPTKPMRI